jgi:hypothetical protein
MPQDFRDDYALAVRTEDFVSPEARPALAPISDELVRRKLSKRKTIRATKTQI